jgi:GxxExxY protein
MGDEIMKVNIKSIIKLCKRIYSELGPYHLEAIYANALEYELLKNDIAYVREFTLPVLYDGIQMGNNRYDF